MSETDNDKPKLGMRAPLGLKRTVEVGKVKQSFSHGRTNTVEVEVKRRRVLGPGPGGAGAQPAAPVAAEPVPAPVAPVAAPVAPRPEVQLSAQERQSKLLREAEEQRMGALEETRRREGEARARAADDERRRAAE
ncbi:MAG: translation initiation factor, partial [Sphingomonas bacterium]|uniref:translation initiation factor IF-2 associated domain-containing protein n=1 Tax=Sphingomonas bacterium TaxID=1895847 RepID=UPI00263134D7